MLPGMGQQFTGEQIGGELGWIGPIDYETFSRNAPGSFLAQGPVFAPGKASRRTMGSVAAKSEERKRLPTPHLRA